MWTGRPLFKCGDLTQTRPSKRLPKRLLEINAPRIDGNLHKLHPLQYDNATTKYAPGQDVHTIHTMASSHYTMVEPNSENTKSLLHRRYNDEDIRQDRYIQRPTPCARHPFRPPDHASTIPARSIGLTFPLMTTQSRPPIDTPPHDASDTPPSSHDHPQRRIGKRLAQWMTNNARHVNPPTSKILPVTPRVTKRRMSRLQRAATHACTASLAIRRLAVHSSTPREYAARIRLTRGPSHHL